MTGDSLGFMFVDLKAIADATAKLGASIKGAGGSVPSLPMTVTNLLPGWAAARIRVEGDALRLDGVVQHKDGTPGPDENRTNAVAGYAPPSTIALVAGNDYGATLKETAEIYEKDPALKDAYAQVEQIAGHARRHRCDRRLDGRHRRRGRQGRRRPSRAASCRSRRTPRERTSS